VKVAIYPGTFDPITHGHLDVIRRGKGLFDRLIIALARNPEKEPFFPIRDRLQMIREVVPLDRNIEVDSFDGLLVDYARRRKAAVVIRGLRALSDFEYEFQMTLMNRKLNPEVETIFLMPNERYTYLNSSVVKEIAMQGGNISELVPESIAQRLYQRYGIPSGSKKQGHQRSRVR
jgi:pantetheine-phosphate adenylyltransferase